MKLRPRYFVALLWHWSIPFLLGAITAFLFVTNSMVGFLPEMELAITNSIREACK